MDRVRRVTLWPLLVSLFVKVLPMNPEPPVKNMFMFSIGIVGYFNPLFLKYIPTIRAFQHNFYE
jgi:hypothetical protein